MVKARELSVEVAHSSRTNRRPARGSLKARAGLSLSENLTPAFRVKQSDPFGHMRLFPKLWLFRKF
jgi:hypothetical protein